jgi:hypothetical protein
VKFALIVEGEGDVAALLVLLRRLTRELGRWDVEVARPMVLPRGKIVKRDELSRHVELAALRTGPDDAILVVFDADDDCAATLGPRLLAWARDQRADRRTRIVVIPREFEAWYLAGAAGLAGRRGLPLDLAAPTNPESIRDAKGWLSRHLGRRYHETRDQAPFAERFDLAGARACRSFARFERIVAELCASEPAL